MVGRMCVKARYEHTVQTLQSQKEFDIDLRRTQLLAFKMHILKRDHLHFEMSYKEEE
jgi:hypothetical protein